MTRNPSSLRSSCIKGIPHWLAPRSCSSFADPAHPVNGRRGVARRLHLKVALQACWATPSPAHSTPGWRSPHSYGQSCIRRQHLAQHLGRAGRRMSAPPRGVEVNAGTIGRVLPLALSAGLLTQACPRTKICQFGPVEGLAGSRAFGPPALPAGSAPRSTPPASPASSPPPLHRKRTARTGPATTPAPRRTRASPPSAPQSITRCSPGDHTAPRPR